MIKSEKAEVYITSDGTRFLTPEEAMEYERELEKTKYYVVHHSPDLNETGQLQRTTYVSANPRHGMGHALMVEDWCYNKFGSTAAYIQGTARTTNWTYSNVNRGSIPEEYDIVVLKD